MKSIKKLLAIMLSVLMAFGIMSFSAFAEDAADDTTTEETVTAEVISEVDVTVVNPVDGDFATGDYVVDGFEYHLTFIQWVEYSSGNVLYSSDKSVETDGNFEAGKSYVVCLTVKANDGYAFDSVENLIVSVNGYEATIADISDDATELSFTCVFDCDETSDDGGEDIGGGFDFDQVLEFLKTLLVTFIRMIGSFFGIS
ncbi:MAG: hypothetical protein IKJ69_06110 [Clostridia bacterium]|nr:hypothetical protein [Clostridia bacterium]